MITTKVQADRFAKIMEGKVTTTQSELEELADGDQFKVIDGLLYEFLKDEKSNKVWDVRDYNLDSDGKLRGPSITGFPLFSFDKKKVYNFALDYPQALTAEEKRLFDKENPFWAKWYQEDL